jgi:SAM-dependent methyltransferase
MAGLRRAPRAAILLAVSTMVVAAAGAGGPDVRLVRWSDVPPAIQERLRAGGLSESALPAFLARLRAETDRRLRDGNFDHLVYYALQSTQLSPLPPIEPALSARTFVETLQRASLPADAAARLDALATVLAANPHDDARLALFRQIAAEGREPADATRDALAERLRAEYVRAMGFLYEKEFVAARAADGRAATAALYQTRAHSTDTQIEAGYAVSVALATLKALDPARRVARVLIVGPGLDLAPRTGLLESAAPQSYQPFAVADALLALGLSARADLRIDLADINPLVIHYFASAAAQTRPLRLDVVSGLPDDERMRLSDDYRAYVQQWGRAIAASERRPEDRADATASSADTPQQQQQQQRTRSSPHLAQTVFVDPAIARAMTATRVNIISDRFTDARQYDLIVITNVLPYFNDAELLLALANISSLLAPGGTLVHNEPRPALLAAAAAIGLPAVQSRTVLLASPAGGQPLHDTILLNRKD